MRWWHKLRGSWKPEEDSERRVWVGDGRLYVQARELPRSRHAAYARGVEGVFDGVEGVRWARFNAALGRVVVGFEPGADLDRLALRVDGLDGLLDLEHLPLSRQLFAGDEEPLYRARFEGSIDLAGAGLALVRKVIGGKATDLEVDLTALLSALDNVPEARRMIEQRFGNELTEVLLSGANALANGMARGALAPLTDYWLRRLRQQALEAQRRAWEKLEPTIGDRPEVHGHETPPPEPRPTVVPDGPIESYGKRAVAAAFGSFGLGLTQSREMSSASGSIFGGVPKPARLGREGFVAVLMERLAERGIVIRCERALLLLDRIDTVVLASEQLDGPERSARSILPAARAAGVRVVARGHHPERVTPDEVVHGGVPLDQVVREQQRRGHVVMVVDGEGATVADLAVGLIERDQVPWSADLLAPNGLEDALFLLDAVEVARKVARQSVQVAAIEGLAGLLLSVRGLKRQHVSAIALGANAASIFAIGNAARLAREVRVRGVGGPRVEVDWHALDPEEVLARVGSAREGLSEEEARERQPPTVEPPTPRERFGQYVLDELANPLAPVLAAGAGLSALTGAVIDAGLIGSVVGFNSVLGAVQRLQTEKALSRFDAREQRQVRVRRGGRERMVDLSELVVGDVIELHPGDVVPADCRLLKSRGLEAEESSLTGESLPVPKSSSKPCDAEAPVAERHTMVFESTSVAAGEATAVVVAVGDETEARRGAFEAAAAEQPQTGVEKRLESLTSFTAPAAAVAGLIVFWAGLSRGRPASEVIGAGVSLAVAAVPEGLPLLATIAQLAAAGRLADRGALVRNPRAVEALGRVSVLCADKTGTLTEGRIRLQWVDDGAHGGEPGTLDESLGAILVAALRAGPRITGERMAHPTDQAILDGAAGWEDEAREPAWQRHAELPFAPGRGFHAVLGHDGEDALVVKGAPEVVLPLCKRHRIGDREVPLDDGDRDQVMATAEELAGRGLRVLVVAERPAEPVERLREEQVDDLTLLGFLGLADPVRPTSESALRALREAGVSVVMITGDHPSTARAIGRQLGLHGELLTGPELEALDEERLAEALERVEVFARVTPAQKVRIVRGFKRLGKMVAMTGDGANDAQAIRLADVGIALGERSTSAARDAADLVVADEKIETIVDAILEGRALWSSVRDAVALLVGGNVGEIVYTLVGGVLTGRSPLNARQLLLLNLLTDTAPAIAIAVAPPSEGTPEELLSEGPDASLGGALTRDILWRALVTGGATSLSWILARPLGTQKRADTVALLTLVGSQLGQALVIAPRSPLVLGTGLGSLALLLAVVETPGVSQFFGCRPLGPIALSQAIGATVGATVAGAVLPKVVRRVAPWLEGPGRSLREEVLAWTEILSESELVRDLSGRSGIEEPAAPRAR